MRYALSPGDLQFATDFEAGRIPPEGFDHRAHVRLASAALADDEPGAALQRVRTAIRAFIARNDIAPDKYHETLTRGWILAVDHFLATTPGVSSVEELLEARPQLLQGKLLLAHYTAGRLFSQEAREQYVEPDLEQFPRHG
jgi:hypothetical protein